MKLFNNITNNISKLIAIAALTITATSCDSSALFDDQGDCDPKFYVKFEYKMHMEKGDAFKEQVKAVDLWLFDEETGEYKYHFYSTVADFQEINNQLLLPIDVLPGKYDFIAWCGDIDNRHFKTNDVIEHKTHTTTRLHKRRYEGQQAVSDENLDLLFHGKLDNAVLPNEEGSYIYTIPLTRDVKSINLTLQHQSGEIDTDNIEVTMLDNNGALNHDNSLDESDEFILYRPWSKRVGTLADNNIVSDLSKKVFGDETQQSGRGNFMNVEFTTSRLMDNHTPNITIKRKDTGDVIFQIPVIDWIKQLRSKKYAEMSDQEYLDRKHDHDLLVLLQDDGNGGWMAVSIVINGWHMIDNGESNL